MNIDGVIDGKKIEDINEIILVNVLYFLGDTSCRLQAQVSLTNVDIKAFIILIGRYLPVISYFVLKNDSSITKS
ncbi:hypothetical protein, partial [Lentilactobacillus kefiri]|uniref:hypothetical protein n=1 Tax=Lentilactobacillus kefiri TaxID=33962 RepID=UPI0031D22446